MYLAARRVFFHPPRRGNSFGTAWHGSHLSSCTAAGPWRRARSSAGSGCPSLWQCKVWPVPSWALLALLSSPAARQERLLSEKQHTRSHLHTTSGGSNMFIIPIADRIMKGITESLRLEKSSNVIKANGPPSSTTVFTTKQ